MLCFQIDNATPTITIGKMITMMRQKYIYIQKHFRTKLLMTVSSVILRVQHHVLYNFKMKSASMASLCCINSIQVCIQALVNELQMQSLPLSTIIVYINSITVYISSIIVHLTVPLYTLTVSLYTLNVITDDTHSIIRMCYELKLCVK